MIVPETISSLFRLSIVIQRATPRDRFVKALASVNEPFDSSYDVAHVGQKFPRLQSEDCTWLRERLGNAITQRRQYLRYCREHREKKTKLGPGQHHDERGEYHPQNAKAPGLAQRPLNLETQSFISSQKPESSFAQTAASTLMVEKLDSAERLSEDAVSKTSFATSVEDNLTSNYLRVARLDEVSQGNATFECPYCWTIQSPKSQNQWR